MDNLINIATKARNRAAMFRDEVKHREGLRGKLCRCGALYEDHSFFGDLCPLQPVPGIWQNTQFVLENRMDLGTAWFEAHSRMCLYEIPRNSFGNVDVDYCRKPIAPATDPQIDYCSEHLTPLWEE
jgi:hypothetical protein